MRGLHLPSPPGLPGRTSAAVFGFGHKRNFGSSRAWCDNHEPLRRSRSGVAICRDRSPIQRAV